QLEEEDPMLRLNWDERGGRIEVQVMGDVQMEILKTMIADRFNIDVAFDAGAIVYKETISAPVIGRGHYEPLRHYAEVHLLMEPLPTGSGLVFESRVSVDELEMNWQRLILTHLAEKRHRGVLTGSELTDVRLTLIDGRAHPKHTEGGDFRQATYRAVRQGLMSADSVLLEPIYSFSLKVPADQVGRAMTDLERMGAKFEPGEHTPEFATLTGTCPVQTMREYRKEVMLYTRGFGELTCEPGGYLPCHNTEEVLEQTGYDAEADIDDPASSVFCAHGAGFVVEWQDVPNYAHIKEYPAGVIPRGLFSKERKTDRAEDAQAGALRAAAGGAGDGASGVEEALSPAERYARSAALDRELESIFRRTYGDKKESAGSRKRTIFDTKKPEKEYVYKPAKQREKYLLVDGYNILFSMENDPDLRGQIWQDLREMVRSDIAGARERLIDILCNYQGFRKMNLILVYDAYKVKGNPGEIKRRGSIDVVYTKEAETADQFIEQVTKQIIKNAEVTVASSDGVEQIIIYGSGAIRMSARELREEIDRANAEIREHLK
ncbi:MAG: TetM/TetW/TetO/TetS family tetracycline resistance ribosomal protection protein, partial [Lachnospiraceae bacterium]|nr:TetM/TetW/TetO/TetS family tetracycline resistance ribosomal protection protein [Lachnospiraceae bacterium]